MKAEQKVPCYELFFAPLAVVFDPNTFERVSFAYLASKYGHAAQIRDDGSRYFDHPKGAAWIYIHELGGRDPRIICDLLLHDIQEDTRLLSTFRVNLNFGTDIALDVRSLTKLPKGKETLAEYFYRVIDRGPRTNMSKIIDRLHNVRTLSGCTIGKQRKQIIETRDVFNPTLIPALREHAGEWAIYADKLEILIHEAMAEFPY